MRVFVNNTEIKIFTGAKVQDALSCYYNAIESALPEPFPLILDQFGNQIESDGELMPGNQLFIVETDNIPIYE